MKQGQGGHRSKLQRIGAALSLDRFAAAKVSKYDKRKVIEKQLALKQRGIKKYKRLKKRLETEGKLPAHPMESLAADNIDGAEVEQQQHRCHHKQIQLQQCEQQQQLRREQQQQDSRQHQEGPLHQQQQQQTSHPEDAQGDTQHKRKHKQKPLSQLQRLADKTAAAKAEQEQQRLQHEQELAERRKMQETKKRERAHKKSDFFKKTKRGQPVMKYRVDKILEQLQKEQSQSR